MRQNFPTKKTVQCFEFCEKINGFYVNFLFILKVGKQKIKTSPLFLIALYNCLYIYFQYNKNT